MLYSPTETPDFYLEVVQELKKRFDRTREVHRALTKTLLDIETPKQTRVDLRKMTDQVRRLISSFKATGFYNLDAFLCSTIYLLLPSKLQTIWDQHTKKDKGVPSVELLLTWLQDHAEALPASTSASEKTGDPPAKKQGKGYNQPSPRKRSQANPVTSPTSEYRWECWICKPQKHPLHLCPKWASYSVTQRLDHVKSKPLCANCLAGGHTLSQCKSTYRCRDCGQNHHTSIHQNSAATPVNSASAKSHQVPDALMTTAQVLLTGPRGQSIQVRALIDSGASLSLLSHKVAQTLGLPLHPSNLQLSGVSGLVSKPVKFFTSLTISPLLHRDKKIPCSPAVVHQVTANIPGEKLQPVHDLPHLLGLHLADEQYNIPDKIDLLLGSDMAPSIMTKRTLKAGRDNEPMAQATEFGWVLSGPAIRSHSAKGAPAASNNHMQPEEAPPLHQLLFEFWQGEESPGDEEPSLSQTEEQAELHYSANTQYLSSQCRYQVTLPKKPDLPPLGDSRHQAVSRFISNERSILR